MSLREKLGKDVKEILPTPRQWVGMALIALLIVGFGISSGQIGDSQRRQFVTIDKPEPRRVSGSGDNLGKTKSELDSKYGNKDGAESLVGTLVETFSNGFSSALIDRDYPGAQVVHYDLDGWSVEATFLPESDACEILEYTKPPLSYGNRYELTSDEIEAALAANSGGQTWEQNGGSWVREDGAQAEINGGSIRIRSALAQRVFVQHKRTEALKEAVKLKAGTKRF